MEENTVEERIILHIRSILSLIEERHQNDSQTMRIEKAEEAELLEGKTFILSFNLIRCVDAVLMTKQILEYTKVISDPQIDMVISDYEIPVTFIAVSNDKLVTTYQKLFSNIKMILLYTLLMIK
jgi:hypothetical protein